MTDATTTVEAGEVSKNTIGEESLTKSSELGVTALEATARARVLAKYTIASKFPRNWDTVSLKLLRECERPGFADVARYSIPRGGKKIEGFSIRFAEAVLRYAGNVDVQSTTVHEDSRMRTIHLAVTDLETNNEIGIDLTIEKTVLLKDTKGRAVLETRKNSTLQSVYLVEATEDEIAQKSGALISKALRTSLLRMVPGDILEDCERKVYDTIQKGDDARDPTENKKRCIDAFAPLGVMPVDLEKYIGASLDTPPPGTWAHMRALHTAIKDGETNWKEALEQKLAERGAPKAAEAEKSSPAEQVKAKAEAAKGPKKAEPKADKAEAPKPAAKPTWDPATQDAPPPDDRGPAPEGREPGTD